MSEKYRSHSSADCSNGSCFHGEGLPRVFSELNQFSSNRFWCFVELIRFDIIWSVIEILFIVNRGLKGHGTLLIILNQQFYKLSEISLVISKDIFRNCFKLIVICAKLDVPLINLLFMS